jgi:hypothetical protein
MRLWRLLEMDSRAVEVSTALIGSAMSASALALRSEWIVAPIIAALWLLLALGQLAAALSCNLAVRQTHAALTMLLFAWLSVHLGGICGIDRPAVPGFAVAALIQAWVFGAIEADRVDARCRERSRVH